MRLLHIVLAVTCLCTTTQARPIDRGGRLGDYADRIAHAHGEHRIEGDVYSAGTMWLGYNKSCVEADARLYFHGAFSLETPDVAVESMSAFMATYYPRPIYRLVIEWLKTTRFSEAHSLDGRQLAALGIRQCK
jgi:hypothetical protein